MIKKCAALVFALCACLTGFVFAAPFELMQKTIKVDSISMGDYCWLKGTITSDKKTPQKTFLVIKACPSHGGACIPCGEKEAVTKQWRGKQLNLVTQYTTIPEHHLPCETGDKLYRVEAIVDFSAQ